MDLEGFAAATHRLLDEGGNDDQCGAGKYDSNKATL
jgi:hypothetical protein